jgi:arsenate reductase
MPVAPGAPTRRARGTVLTIYSYDKCSTCKKALGWLAQRRIPYQVKPIRDQPPSIPELKKMLAHQGDLKRLFNTSGKDYRDMKLGSKLGTLTEDQALGLLAKHGNLVKRPFVLTARAGLVGFDAATWSSALG